tara:strand:- start:50916 stop:51188 length:273 start_codon:yes stop_codon:yes gene_type:complete
MKIHVFSVEAKDIPDKEHPAHSKQSSMLITPYNKNLLKAGENRFQVSIVTPDNEPFNLQKLEEVAVCRDLERAKEVALYFATKDTNFITH